MGAGVLIYGEVRRVRLAPVTLELLGVGRRLADVLGAKLTGLFLGEEISDVIMEAIHYGADKVVQVEAHELRGYQPELYLAVMERVCKESEPDLLLMSHNSIGADLAPRIAFRLGTGLTTDCIDLGIDPETKLLFCTKPIYGGNAIAVYSSKYRPQVATVREKAFSPLERDSGRKGEVVSFDPGIESLVQKVKFVEVVKEDIPGVKLEEAEVIVCGGRGLGSPEEFDGFAQLWELAAILGGAVAGSRPVCEKGWIHPRLQVGLTGKKVTPRLYIAVGVSGASQHLAGMLGSKNIVAINNDPKANIFKEAHYSAVGDYREILPAFKEKIKEILNDS